MAKKVTAKNIEKVVTDVKTAIKGEVAVVWKGGSRTYTRAQHGDSFMKLAEEFASKKEGELA